MVFNIRKSNAKSYLQVWTCCLSTLWSLPGNYTKLLNKADKTWPTHRACENTLIKPVFKRFETCEMKSIGGINVCKQVLITDYHVCPNLLLLWESDLNYLNSFWLPRLIWESYKVNFLRMEYNIKEAIQGWCMKQDI